MLARRLTIISLVILTFGFLFAQLVRSDHATRRGVGGFVSCHIDAALCSTAGR